MAMHKPPGRSSIKSADSAKKKFSFATFEQYTTCTGYRYPATQNRIDTVLDGGYEVPAQECVIIPQPAQVDFQWTVARPPIVFGIVAPLPNSDRRATSCSSTVAPISLELINSVHGEDQSTRTTEAGFLSVQNADMTNSPTQHGSPSNDSPIQHDSPLIWTILFLLGRLA